LPSIAGCAKLLLPLARQEQDGNRSILLDRLLDRCCGGGQCARAHGILWFLLSLLISPLIALLLVLFMELKNVPSAAPPPSIPDAAFEPDSVYAGIPYRLSPDGSIEAVIQGARMWFSDYQKFAAVIGGPMLPSMPSPADRDRAKGQAGAG